MLLHCLSAVVIMVQAVAMEVKLTIADDLISGKTLCRMVNEYTNKQIRLTSYTTIEENGNYSGSNKWALNKDGDNYKFYAQCLLKLL